uniref:tRNA pseudouridine synthase A, mitochondrial-like n=1 Tax=Sinocyclocheilus grahami TaxID=75366 RepID=A0A672SI06_SINGR
MNTATHFSETIMAPSTDSNVKGETSRVSYKKDINTKTDRVLQNKKHANDIFDVTEYLQSEKDKEVIFATNACSKIFCQLIYRGDLYLWDTLISDKLQCVIYVHYFHIFQETSLCALMKFVAAEGKHPLQNLDLSEHYNFPRELLRTLVEHLLSEKEDMSLLISRFQEFLEMDDVRYYVMSSVRDNIYRVMGRNKKVSVVVFTLPVFQLFVLFFLYIYAYLFCITNKLEEWKVAKLKEHKRAFEQMWLVFLKFKLPSNMYKKILVILHESIMPQMSDPTLLIDFLSAAYDIGGAISLLSLNGLFILIHKHNLDYPDFYKKLYSLLDPSIFHVKYRARFFHLVNIFLSSTHLPAYLVAAFVKRFARLSLTAPPTSLLILLPFICNLIRRHPSCRVLIHRPSTPCDDPYVMEEEDPAQSHALESSLWEIKTLQKHYHPDVAKAAMKINEPLAEQEDDISELLELSTFELMERELKAERKTIPLEFDAATELLKSSREVLGVHFSLE